MVTLTSSSTSNTSFGLVNNENINNNNNLHDVSFSSYLNKNEETYVWKLAEPNRSFKGFDNILNPQEKLQYNTAVVTGATRKKEQEEPEIGVFGAEKYFNGEMDSDNSPRLVSQPNREVHGYVKNERLSVNSRANTKSAGTPSVRSELSWNSQSALLQNAAKKSGSDSSLRKTEKSTSKKSFFANLGCKCSCSDENSVDVDEKSSPKKNTDSGFLVHEKAAIKLNSPPKINGLSRENPFVFPPVSSVSSESGIADLTAKPKLLEKQVEEIQRKSLEVFGSPVLEKRSKSLCIEKKPMILPWDLNPRIKEDEYEDSESDASSDLFEIESLTGKPKTFLARQGSDPASPTAYPPSEASIAWSVVTASAADFSVMSECAASPIRNKVPLNNYPNSKSDKERQSKKSSSGLLLGCKSQKSVRVSGDLQRTTNQNTNYVTRFQAEAKPTGFEARNRTAGR